MLQHAHLHPGPSVASIQLATERAIGMSAKNGVGLERTVVLAIRKCLWLHFMHKASAGADVEVFKWPDTWHPRSQQMQQPYAVRKSGRR
jgi:hypothetical protein